MEPGVIFLACAVVLVLISFIVWICSRYRKCPSDKIMVVYGSIGKNKDGTNRSAKCIHGGAEFVIPVFQSYAYLDFSDCIDRLVKKAMFTKYEENTLRNPEILSLSMKK